MPQLIKELQKLNENLQKANESKTQVTTIPTTRDWVDVVCQCDGCGFTANYDDLPPAVDLSMRLSVGGVYSDVECPKCGALCFPVE